MQKLITAIIRYIPQLLLALSLVLVQLLFINSNIIGIYLFGRIYTTNNYYKIFTTVTIVTLLYDAIKIAYLGTWALSFYLTAAICESILYLTKAKNELKSGTMRGILILISAVAISSIAQSYLLQILTGQALAIQGQFSIVILSILYVIIHTVASKKKNYEYLHL